MRVIEPFQADADYACPTCPFRLYWTIASMRTSTLGLYDDARFPGRCILVLNQHAEHLADLPDTTARLFLADVQAAGRAIRTATSATRINYAILGNVEPHVHAHLIPRGLPGDPMPNDSPWRHPDPVRSMALEQRSQVLNAIRCTLERAEE